MQADPIFEMQRLAAHYRELSDDELRDLAANFADLTETAQRALRTEMQSRRLGDPPVATNAPAASNAPLTRVHDFATSAPIQNQAGNVRSFFAFRPEIVPDMPDPDAELDGPVDYTWKTPLCECDTLPQARELSGALERAGIECWVEAPGSAYGYIGSGFTKLRVLVAADQLDQARVIAAQPIPRQIIDDAQTEIPDYQPPNCPKCGAPDPVLEGVDPANSWRCEQCGQHWSDPASPEQAPTAPTTTT
jgi:ribosomal protein L37AE/L43A